jgi:hypothetical protein
MSWAAKETTTHQDHVIAHVVGAAVLGYFVFDEALHILLDIGFVWTIFLDGEMNLLPHPVAIGELELDAEAARAIKADIDSLLGDNSGQHELLRMKSPSAEHRFEIRGVDFFEQADQRRLLLDCGELELAIETSLTAAGINVYESKRSKS